MERLRGEDWEGGIYVRPVERLTPARKAETIQGIVLALSSCMNEWSWAGRLTEDCVECVVGETAELFRDHVSLIWGLSELHS